MKSIKKLLTVVSTEADAKLPFPNVNIVVTPAVCPVKVNN